MLARRQYANLTNRIVLFLGTLAMCIASGCGNRGPERVIVSGTVTYNGKPINEGLIRFVPTGGSSAPVASTPIVSGKYKIAGRGGAPVGPVIVQVEAYMLVPSSLKPGEAIPPDMPQVGSGVRRQFLGRHHNAESKLEYTVPSGNPEITKDFDLKN
jgi:hypothetical protein